MEKIRAQEKYWKDMIVKHINPSIYRSPYNSVWKTNMSVFPETQNKWQQTSGNHSELKKCQPK